MCPKVPMLNASVMGHSVRKLAHDGVPTPCMAPLTGNSCPKASQICMRPALDTELRFGQRGYTNSRPHIMSKVTTSLGLGWKSKQYRETESMHSRALARNQPPSRNEASARPQRIAPRSL